MKSIIKCVCFMLCMSIVVGSLYGFTSENEADEATKVVRDEKIYCNATINQEFDDSSILVVMDNVTGGINKQHELSFFGDIGASSVKDLTALSSDKLNSGSVSVRGTSENSIVSAEIMPWFEVNTETFRQILKIELLIHSKENVLNVIKKLERIEGIKYVGPNYYSRSLGEFDNLISNDKWELLANKMNAVDAWDITTGSHKVKVGIIDSGISEHPYLNDNLVEGVNFVDNTGTGDTDGHGTHIAGIIGAVAEEPFMAYGICWDVTLVPLKTTSEVTPRSYDALIAAISYATSEGIQILNYSAGGESDCPAVAQAIMNYPGLFVAATDDKARSSDTYPIYPANYTTVLDNVISVGASDESDDIWYDAIDDGSNYGAISVDLFASGVNITGTMLYSESYPYLLTDEAQGTSMATPQVVGAAALIMSARPDMTPAEIKKCILNSVDKLDGQFEGKCVSGGRLNIYKAVQLATQPQTFTGDVNGDGKADMIITRRQSNGNRAIDAYLGQSDGTFGSAITTNYTQVYNYQDPVFTGDINGDGRTDLIVHSVVTGKRYLLVYRGNADGSFTGASLCATTDDHDYYTMKAKYFVADANGDGKDDFIVHIKNSNGKRSNLTYLGQVSGDIGYFNSTASTFTSTNNYGASPVFVGDFNGDGKADMVVPHATSNKKRCLLVYKGQSSAPYFATGVKFNSTRTHDPLTYPCQQFISDVNGDGKDDLVVHWKNASGMRNNLVYKGGSSGLTTDAVATGATSNTYYAKEEVFVGDINGDGYDDMLIQRADTSNKRNLLVYKGKSDATYEFGANDAKSETLDLVSIPSCFFLADVSGTGRNDFIVKYYNNGNTAFITYIGKSVGYFSYAKYSTVSTIPYFNN